MTITIPIWVFTILKIAALAVGIPLAIIGVTFINIIRKS